MSPVVKRERDGLFRKKKSPYWYFKAPRRGEPDKYDDISTKETDSIKAQAFKVRYLDKLKDGRLPNERAKWTVMQALDHELEVRTLSRRRTSAAPNRTSRNHLVRILGAKVRLRR